jgi:hypothetical protein
MRSACSAREHAACTDRYHGGASTPRQAWTDKRERQYEHIKENEEARGRPEGTAERIAAATVNRTGTAKGETNEPRRHASALLAR